MSEQYRRKDDDEKRLLWQLNERVTIVKEMLKPLADKYSNLPCRSNDIRLKFIEKVLFAIGAGTLGLMGKLIYDLLIH